MQFHLISEYVLVVAGRTCFISFRANDGKLWCHVTAAETVFGAVREGWEFFQDPFWRGPTPSRDTTFEISLVGDERRWLVKAKRAVH